MNTNAIYNMISEQYLGFCQAAAREFSPVAAWFFSPARSPPYVAATTADSSVAILHLGYHHLGVPGSIARPAVVVTSGRRRSRLRP